MWRSGTITETADGISNSALTTIGLLSALGIALVGSLFSSDAWNNVTFISGEIENPKKNIPLALLIGTLSVSVIYFFANIAYLHLLPFYGNPHGASIFEKGIMFADQDRVGVSAAFMIFGGIASVIMAVLIMVSTFSCNNGIILSSARLFQAMAKDGLFFDRMKNNNEAGVPSFALWVQCIWASVLCLSGKYGLLLDYIMFPVMFFYIITIAGIFILRKNKPELDRPYKVWGYPIIPVLYILLAALFCINLLINKPLTTYPGFGIVLLGIPVYYYWQNKQKTV